MLVYYYLSLAHRRPSREHFFSEANAPTCHQIGSFFQHAFCGTPVAIMSAFVGSAKPGGGFMTSHHPPQSSAFNNGVCCSPCCSVVDEAEEVLWARRRRQELRDNIQKVKGVSADSECSYSKDVEAVVDEMQCEDPSTAIIPSSSCACGLRPGAFSTCFCMLIWIVVYAAIMVALQLQLYKLLRDTEFETVAGKYLNRADIAFYLNNFHWFFSISTTIMTIAVTATFGIARLLFGLQLYTLSGHVVEGVHDEYASELKENLNGDYYQYIKRLNKYVVVSDDFTKGEMKKLHRKLNIALADGGQFLNYYDRSKIGVRKSIDEKVRSRRAWISLIFFAVPWAINLLGNCTLMYHVFDLRYHHHHSVQVEELPQFQNSPIRGLRSEGLRLIAYAVAINLVTWLYLTIVMAGNSTYCLLKCLYPRIRLGAVSYVNRMIHRIWDEIVVDGLAPFIEEVRPTLLFIEESDDSSPWSGGKPAHAVAQHPVHFFDTTSTATAVPQSSGQHTTGAPLLTYSPTVYSPTLSSRGPQTAPPPAPAYYTPMYAPASSPPPLPATGVCYHQPPAGSPAPYAYSLIATAPNTADLAVTDSAEPHYLAGRTSVTAGSHQSCPPRSMRGSSASTQEPLMTTTTTSLSVTDKEEDEFSPHAVVPQPSSFAGPPPWRGFGKTDNSNSSASADNNAAEVSKASSSSSSSASFSSSTDEPGLLEDAEMVSMTQAVNFVTEQTHEAIPFSIPLHMASSCFRYTRATACQTLSVSVE